MSKFSGTVLALDLATTAGWACGKPGSKPRFGHITFAKPGSSRARIYRAFRNWLENEWNVRDAQPDLVVFESAAAPMVMQGRTNIDTIKTLIGLTEHLEEFCYENIELREASVQQVRAHFIGANIKSALAKPATVARCRQLGWMAETSDEADALALLDYQLAYLRADLAYRTTPLFQGR